MTGSIARRFAAAAAILALPVVAAPALGGTAGAAAGDPLPQGTVAFTDLTLPYGVAVTADGAVVATSYSDGVSSVARVLRHDGTAQTTVTEGTLGSPFGVAVDAAGNSYVTDASEGTVTKFPKAGGAGTKLAFTGLSFPTGIAVDAGGNVYVADTDNGRIVKLAGSTQSVVAFTGLQSPYGLAVDASGSIFVADTGTDTVVKLVGTTQSTLGFSGLADPDGLAVDSKGTVYVADSGNNRVVSLVGSTQSVVPLTGLSEPAGLAVDKTDGLYVADAANNRIVTRLTEQATPRTANQSFAAAAYQDFIGRAPTAGELSTAVASLGGATPATAAQRTAFIKTLANSDQYLGSVVNKLYQDTLGRNGDAGGVAYWTGTLRSGKYSVAEVGGQFYASGEYFKGFGNSNLDTWIRDLYAKVLKRPADSGGLAHWTGIAQKKGRNAVSLPMFQSNESARTRVATVYQRLLGRGTDAAGVKFWAPKVIASGDVTLAVSIATSNEYLNKSATRFP